MQITSTYIIFDFLKHHHFVAALSICVLFGCGFKPETTPLPASIRCVEYSSFDSPLIMFNGESFSEVYKARLYLQDSIVVAVLPYKVSKLNALGAEVELSEFEQRKRYLVYERDSLYGYLYDTTVQLYRHQVKLDSILKYQFFIEQNPYP